MASEIDATLLTDSDWGECRVSGEHFGQTYVGSRCAADIHQIGLCTATGYHRETRRTKIIDAAST